MAYTVENFKTKKALREAVVAWERGERGLVEVYQPGPFGPVVHDGTVPLEGPHYPEPHRWWATAKVRSGHIVGPVK
jgi:hypothetical protein